MKAETGLFLDMMGLLQQGMDSTDSPSAGFTLSLQADLLQTLVPIANPGIAQDLHRMHVQEVYCQGGVLAVAADSVEQMADMFGAEHAYRAIDFDDKYTAGEQVWHGAQAAAHVFLFWSPFKRVAPKTPPVAGPPPLPVRAAPLPSPRPQPSSPSASCCQAPVSAPKVCGPDAPRPPPQVGDQCVAPPRKVGSSGGGGAGKGFSRKVREAAVKENAELFGGKPRCSSCLVDVIPAKKSTRGVKPPSCEIQIDHVYPRSKGGNNSLSNAEVLCRRCNRAKSDKTK
jgi:5-methylcytosine-specific restriction endonuclease McrA